MQTEHSLGDVLFGYHTIVKEGEEIITLKGDLVTELDAGMKVQLLGNDRGYIPGGFTAGEEVTILGFTLPFTNGSSDHIIHVSNGQREDWVKPSNILITKYHTAFRAAADARHARVKRKISPDFARLMDAIYRAMNDAQRAALPADTMSYVEAITAYALENLDDWNDQLAFTIAAVYNADSWNRFIKDPLRSNSQTAALLFLDKDGFIISVVNYQLVQSTTKPLYQYINGYDYYSTLTGPQKGRKFYSDGAALAEPVYRENAHSPANNDQPSATINNGRKPVRIFISYAHKDEKMKDELVEHLSGLKNTGVIESWTDRELLAGQSWDDSIKQQLEEARVILFLVSASFMNSGYINEIEVKRSLEKHGKGEAIIVPVIIRYCDFGSLPLQKYQALPKNAKPIEDWKPRNKGWLDVVNQLRKMIEAMK